MRLGPPLYMCACIMFCYFMVCCIDGLKKPNLSHFTSMLTKLLSKTLGLYPSGLKIKGRVLMLLGMYRARIKMSVKLD